MALTLGQAAKAANRSKTTISRAIASGKLSATRKPDHSFEIDPAELRRVWPDATPAATATATVPPGVASDALQREVALLRERLADKDQQIFDLRHRLDESEAERRQLSLRLLPEPRSWWWRRWRR